MPTRTFVVIGAIGVLTLAPISRASSQTAHTDMSSALLVEVRLLRTTIEKIASAGAAGQLILGRLQLQEQRVNATVQRLERAQAELAEKRQRSEEVADSIAVYEEWIKGDRTRRKRHHHLHEVGVEDLQEMIEFSKKDANELAEDIRRLTTEEAARASDLAAEQAVWSTLNQRLDEAERVLARKQ
jgi:hypothetical protein